MSASGAERTPLPPRAGSRPKPSQPGSSHYPIHFEPPIYSPSYRVNGRAARLYVPPNWRIRFQADLQAAWRLSAALALASVAYQYLPIIVAVLPSGFFVTTEHALVSVA